MQQFYFIGSTDHWICTSRKSSASVVQVMDSLSSITSVDILLQIAKIYPVTKSTLQINRLLFSSKLEYMISIAYAVDMCFKRDVQKATFEQKSMRKHLHDCFNSGASSENKITPHVHASLGSQN